VSGGEKVMDPCENGYEIYCGLKITQGILLTQKESQEPGQHFSKVKSGDIKVSSKIEVFLKLLLSHSYVK